MNNKLFKTQYPALENIQIQMIQDKTAGIINENTEIANKTNLKTFYCRNNFFKKVLSYLLPKRPPNKKADEMIANYFRYSLNPIYEKISKLPQQVFICGFCKELYYGPSEYLLHCFQLDCPVNHDRSTYFFYFKDNFAQIKNSDILQTLTQNELAHFRSISYRKRSMLLMKLNINPLQKDSQKFVYCGKCKLKNENRLYFMFTHYVPHCLLKCKSTKLSTNSHSLTPIQIKQDLIAFVDDAINLAINLNIISLYYDSYVKLEQNLKNKVKSTYDYFCANCESNFTSQPHFIQHCLFQCKDKINSKSSHVFKRKIVQQKYTFRISHKGVQKFQNKTAQIQKEVNKVEFIREKVETKVEIKKSSSLIQFKTWDTKINPRFTEIQDLFHNIYFCGQCYCHFQDQVTYLAHSLSSLCPLNQPRNSHFFYEKDSGETLTTKTIQIYVDEMKKIDPFEVKENPQFVKKWKENIQVTDKITKEVLKPGKNDTYHCGKCGQNFKKQQGFIFHSLKDCFSSNHEASSHIIEFKKNKTIVDDEFKQFIISYIYAVRIIKISGDKKYKITKNIFIDVDPDYLCGKCDTIFGNLYEYVLHSLEVCKNLRCKYSSHFINHGFLKVQSKAVQWPLDIVLCEDMPQKLWKRQQNKDLQLESEQKIAEPQLMDINENHSKIEAKNHQSSQEKLEYIMNKYQNVQRNNIPKNFDPNNQIQKLPKVLRPNIEYKPNRNQKYYCGQCMISFRREWDFENHMKQCGCYENANSSHFLITNQRYTEINFGRILSHTNRKNFPKTISNFNHSQSETIRCGCGEELPSKKYNIHIRDKHNGKVQKRSSHIILRIMLLNNLQPELICLPVDSKIISEQHEFVCPCDPWKKYKYSQFVNHMIKRHEGKSPKFWMRHEGQN